MIDCVDIGENMTDVLFSIGVRAELLFMEELKGKNLTNTNSRKLPVETILNPNSELEFDSDCLPNETCRLESDQKAT